MQLKTKFIHLTIIIIVLLGLVGGVNLWLMRHRFATGVEQNAAVLLRIESIRNDGFEMIGGIESLAAIQARTGVFPMRDVSGADKQLARFNNSYNSLQQNIEALVDEKEQLFCSDGPGVYCDLFLEKLNEHVGEVDRWGLLLIGAGSEKTLQGAQKTFDTVVTEFIAFIDDAVVRQSGFFQEEMEREIKRSRQLLLIYCVEGLVIVILAIIVVNCFSSNISKRLKEMNVMVEKAGAGKFFIRLQDDEQDELGELARKMNVTAAYLDETRQSLEETTKELALQLEERRAVEARLAEEATHDSLTGLPNRQAFLSSSIMQLLCLIVRKEKWRCFFWIWMD